MRLTGMFGVTARTSFALLLAALASTAAAAKAPNLEVVGLAPTSNGVVVFEPQAQRAPDAPPTAILNLDITLRNKELTPVELKTIGFKFAYANGQPPGGLLPPVIYGDIKKALTGDESPYIPAGKERKVLLPSAYGHRYPLPTGVTVELRFAGFADPLVVYTRLGEYRNPTPTGGYRFPARAADLKPGERWYEGGTHAFGGHHRPFTEQRHAYDLGVKRWDEGTQQWVKTRLPKSEDEVVDGKQNDHLLVYGKPVYAVAGGKVVRCWRDAEENPKPGVEHPGVEAGTIPRGGNGLWVDHGNGEFALYAHFQKNSVPLSLCPENGDIDANHPVVKAGEKIGLAGNSGQSGGPHLHFHVQVGAPKSGQGVPVLFHGIRASTSAGAPDDGWVVVIRKAPPTGPVLIEPYDLNDKIQTSAHP